MIAAIVPPALPCGVIDLIAKGYGALTWVFIAVLVVPLFTVGLWKITR